MLNGELWGTRKDGWVRFDLQRAATTHFRAAGAGVSNDTYGLTHFDNTWFVATRDALVLVESSDLR